MPQPFYVKDCALAPIATGQKARTLIEFRDVLKTISAESIYYHFWRQSLEATLVPGAFFNDFSYWFHYHLHDDILAERLALRDPTEYKDLEKLREDIIDVVENRLDEMDEMILCPHIDSFYFIRSKIVIFNTPHKIDHPKDLVKTIPLLSHSSIFYHFIDARRREIVALDDFSSWLHGYEDEFTSLIQQIKQIDPYFISLSDLHQKLTSIVTEYFLDNPDKNKDSER